MNRLFIVGNGFDLSHRMKTTYYDFVLDYLKGCFKEASKKGLYTDNLIEVKRKSYCSRNLDEVDLEYLLSFKKAKILLNFLGGNNSDYETNSQFSLLVKTDFFERILTECQFNRWVDIENEYYYELKKIINSKNANELTVIEKLNSSMDTLIEKINSYLSNQESAKLNENMRSVFEEKIKKDDILMPFLDEDLVPLKNLILDFNYTNTTEKYLKYNFSMLGIQKDDVEINHIHGQINKKENPIIFGFGDEHDSDYLKMGLDKRKGVFKFIKSFSYFKTSNYHNLIRFIDSDEFQVFILGHSCGLSDRTMLKMVFEHQLCKSIKIFYHKTQSGNNYTELTQEISRHFKDKAEMRRKIVPFDKSSELPQLNL